MGVHNGHRERLKNRFIEHGLVNFNELNALELLLFYAIPRKDTNELAHALLDRFETLSGVFEASFQELTEVPGIGETALKKRACSVILAHNHPDGLAIPSREDDIVTKQVCTSLDLVGIPLIDHIIVSGDDFVSYADSGFLGLYRY